MLIVEDDAHHFTLQEAVRHESDMPGLSERVVAMPVRHEMLYAEKWHQHLMLAECYQFGRVFLVGDSVHLVIPTGGLGMNTGVGDAADLAWKLWATLAGWGGPKLLASHEAERRPVGERGVVASGFGARGRQVWGAVCIP